MNAYRSRLAALEERCHGKHLLCLARLPDGTEAILTAKEMVLQDAYLVRVISGNSLSDLDIILNQEKEVAFKEV